MNNIQKLFKNKKNVEDFVSGYFAYLSEIFNKIDKTELSRFIDCLLTARERDSKIFFIGNGGSAATASHFANDLAIGTRSHLKPFRVISLTDNNAVMTAIANDYGYEDIFYLQLKALLSPNDVVVAISASGNSINVIKAIQYANDVGATTVGLTGFDGGKLKMLATIGLHVPTNKGEYGPVEDLHMIFDHLVGAYLYELCKEEKND